MRYLRMNSVFLIRMMRLGSPGVFALAEKTVSSSETERILLLNKDILYLMNRLLSYPFTV